MNSWRIWTFTDRCIFIYYSWSFFICWSTCSFFKLTFFVGLALWHSKLSFCLQCCHPIWAWVWTPAAVSNPVPCWCARENNSRWSNCLGPYHLCGRPRWSCRLLTSDMSSHSRCNHLGRESEVGISLSATPLFTLYSAFKQRKKKIFKNYFARTLYI